jgi:hypothetical protein
MMFLPYIQTAPTVDSVLTRLQTFSKQAKTLGVDMKLTSNGTPTVGNARIIFSRPGHNMLFTLKWQNLDYGSTTTPTGGWNADYQQHEYEDTVNKDVQAVFSDISSAPYLAFPAYLTDGNFHYGNYHSFVYKGQTDIDGEKTDQLEGKYNTKTIDVYIAQDGSVPRARVTSLGNNWVQCDFSHYAVNKPIPLTAFGSSSPPSGFREYELPFVVRPVGIGEVFPTGHLISATHGSLTGNDLKNRPALVEVTEADSFVSDRTASFLQHMKATGLNVAVVSLSKSGTVPDNLRSFTRYYDPTGATIDLIDAPGTPLFYLLGKNGMIKKVWLGFDADEVAKLEQDVKQSLK